MTCQQCSNFVLYRVAEWLGGLLSGGRIGVFPILFFVSGLLSGDEWAVDVTGNEVASGMGADGNITGTVCRHWCRG